MPSWSKSYWIAFWSVIAGLLLSIFWLVLAGIVIISVAFFRFEQLASYVQQGRYYDMLNLPAFIGAVLVVVFFLVMSSLSFYAVLVKYTWNEVHQEVSREVSDMKNEITSDFDRKLSELKRKKCINCGADIPSDSVICLRCKVSQV